MPIEKMKPAIAPHVTTPNESQCASCWRTVRPERRGAKKYCPHCKAEFQPKGD